MDAHSDPAARSPCFEAERWIVAANGKSAVVRLAQRVDDVAVFVNREVQIDGCPFTCLRVDAASHSPPYRTGEYIALLVEALE
jgi:hypothetical protein